MTPWRHQAGRCAEAVMLSDKVSAASREVLTKERFGQDRERLSRLIAFRLPVSSQMTTVCNPAVSVTGTLTVLQASQVSRVGKLGVATWLPSTATMREASVPPLP